ncbi:MAG: alpha/beta fold hydrolase [Elusimicrobiota bacterium]
MKGALGALLAAALAAAGCARSPESASDVPRADCGKGPGFEYCLYSPPAGAGHDTRTLLYHLHGNNESHLNWGGWFAAKAYYRSFRERGIPAPTVATVSYGKLWLLTEAGPGPADGLLEHFVSEAMPFIEERAGKPERRLLWGMSMGGFNAAQLLLKHPSLWDSVVLSCPAITSLPPDADQSEIDAFIARTGADPDRVKWILEQSGRQFPSPERWRRHDPLSIAPRSGPLPPTFIECGDRDEYGFFEGARRLSEELSSAGQPVRFKRTAGAGHCAVTPGPILSFLQEAASGG